MPLACRSRVAYIRAMKGRAIGFAILVSGLLGGCAVLAPQHPADTWATFIGGDDIRAACRAGGPDELRVIGAPDDRTGAIRIYQAVAGDSNVTLGAWTVRPGDPPPDPAHPQSHVFLSAEALSTVFDRLAETGAFEGGTTAWQPPADGFGWLVSGCHDGVFFRAGYTDPTLRPFDIGWWR